MRDDASANPLGVHMFVFTSQWDEDNARRVFENAARAGYDNVEILIQDVERHDSELARRMSEEFELGVVSAVTGTIEADLGSSDAASVARGEARLVRAIRLSAEAEPEIFATTRRFGTVLENTVRDPITREVDFDDESKTENTRSAYPLDFIPNASRTGRAGIPKNIVMLTADAFGVMPPIAKLTPAEAMYHFLSGYTAKVAGTERGLTGVQPEFSTCFGSPFLPRHPSEYANLLRDFIAKHHVDCWLVNTGWTGGQYGTGRRMPIRVTRRLLSAALDGSLNRADFRRDPYFGFAVPTSVPGVEPHILYPVKTWADKAAFAETAKNLTEMFAKNFAKFEAHVDDAVQDAAPSNSLAA